MLSKKKSFKNLCRKSISNPADKYKVNYYTSYECEIWKAFECLPGPIKDDEELMKTELYTNE